MPVRACGCCGCVLCFAGATQNQLEQPQVALRFLHLRLAVTGDHGQLYRCKNSETVHAMSEDKLSAT